MIDYMAWCKDKQIVTHIAKYLGVQAKPFNFDSRRQSKLLIGSNNMHEVAAMICDKNLPLIVFDRHTDMYCSKYRNDSRHPPEDENAATWIYFMLKEGREVHLVMPKLELIYDSSWLPENNKLTLYSRRGTGEARFVCESNGKVINVLKEAHKLNELSQLKNTRKQISIDEDFFNDGWKAGDLEQLLAPIASPGDRIDFWLEGIYYTSPKTIADGLRKAIKLL